MYIHAHIYIHVYMYLSMHALHYLFSFGILGGNTSNLEKEKN